MRIHSWKVMGEHRNGDVRHFEIQDRVENQAEAEL